MTTCRLFTHRRDSVRWVALAMAAGLIALAVAALACGPAAPGSPGAGETAANAAASDQHPGDGSEPFVVPQQSGTTEPEIPPTTCSTYVEDGVTLKDCMPGIPPTPEGFAESNMSSALFDKVQEAQEAEAKRQRGGGDAAGGRSLPAPEREPEIMRVWIFFEHGNNGDAIVEWLDDHGFKYEDVTRTTGHMHVLVDILLLPELAQVDGVHKLRHPIRIDPAG